MLEKFLLQGKQVYLRNVLSRQADHLQEIANLVINIVLSVWMFKIQGSEKTCSIQPLWIQDSKFGLRKKTFSIQPLWVQHSRFKIQGSEKTCSIQSLWIQDSRFEAQIFFFNPTCLDSRCKIQDSRLRIFFSTQPLWIQDSRFKAQKKKSSTQSLWIQD